MTRQRSASFCQPIPCHWPSPQSSSSPAHLKPELAWVVLMALAGLWSKYPASVHISTMHHLQGMLLDACNKLQEISLLNPYTCLSFLGDPPLFWSSPKERTHGYPHSQGLKWTSAQGQLPEASDTIWPRPGWFPLCFPLNTIRKGPASLRVAIRWFGGWGLGWACGWFGVRARAGWFRV